MQSIPEMARQLPDHPTGSRKLSKHFDDLLSVKTMLGLTHTGIGNMIHVMNRIN